MSTSPGGVRWWAQPKAQYHAMQQVPAMEPLVERIDEYDRLLAENHRHERVRKRQFPTDAGWVWILEVEAGRQRWLLVWGLDADDVPEVRALTPAPPGL